MLICWPNLKFPQVHSLVQSDKVEPESEREALDLSHQVGGQAYQQLGLIAAHTSEGSQLPT